MTTPGGEAFDEKRLAACDACLEKALAFASAEINPKYFKSKSPRVKVVCWYQWGGVREPTMPFEIYQSQMSGVHHFLNIWMTMTKGDFTGFSAEEAILADKA